MRTYRAWLLVGSVLLYAFRAGPPSTRSAATMPLLGSAAELNGNAQSSRCGQAVWMIVDLKSGNTLFKDKADCTTVENNPYLESIVSNSWEINVQYGRAGTTRCPKSDDGSIAVTVTDGHEPYTAGFGNPPPPGTSCEFTIDDLPKFAKNVSGSLSAVLARCTRAGGCSKDSDWDRITVKGSFEAFYPGP